MGGDYVAMAKSLGIGADNQWSTGWKDNKLTNDQQLQQMIQTNAATAEANTQVAGGASGGTQGPQQTQAGFMDSQVAPMLDSAGGIGPGLSTMIGAASGPDSQFRKKGTSYDRLFGSGV